MTSDRNLRNEASEQEKQRKDEHDRRVNMLKEKIRLCTVELDKIKDDNRKEEQSVSSRFFNNDQQYRTDLEGYDELMRRMHDENERV